MKRAAVKSGMSRWRLLASLSVATLIASALVVLSPSAAFATGPTVTMTVNSIGRNFSTDGSFTYNVSGTVTGLGPTDVCGVSTGYTSSCYADLDELQAGSTDWTSLASASLDSGGSSYSFSFVSPVPESSLELVNRVASLRIVITAHNTYVPDVSTGWIPISDPYPSAATAAVKIKTFGRTPDGYLHYNIDSVGRAMRMRNTACGYYSSGTWCEAELYVKYADNTTQWFADYNGPAEADTNRHSFSDTWTYASTSKKIVAVRVVFYGGLGAEVDGPWQRVADKPLSETQGGQNASEKGCSCTNGDPVNTETGEFYDPVTDLGAPGVGPAVALSRTYSTTGAGTSGPFGYGWSTNFTSHLVVDTAGDSSDPLPRQLHIVQENGATVPFTEASDGTYPAAPWVLATLTHDAISGDWTLARDKSGHDVTVFDSSGNLISTSDLHGNQIDYGYSSGHVASITGSGGREIDLTWSSGRISAIADSSGRAVAYSYDSSGNLTTVDAADNGIWQYSYDSNHRILTETHPDGGVLTNTYNSYGQVATQTDPVGRVTGFSYSNDQTTTTLPDGSVSVSSYDQGQLASLTTAYGTAIAATTTYSYDDDGNRTSVTDPLGKVTSNSFDSAGNGSVCFLV